MNSRRTTRKRSSNRRASWPVLRFLHLQMISIWRNVWRDLAWAVKESMQWFPFMNQADSINSSREVENARTEANQARAEAIQARAELDQARTALNQAREDANQARTTIQELQYNQTSSIIVRSRMLEQQLNRLKRNLTKLGPNVTKLEWMSIKLEQTLTKLDQQFKSFSVIKRAISAHSVLIRRAVSVGRNPRHNKWIKIVLSSITNEF